MFIEDFELTDKKFKGITQKHIGMFAYSNFTLFGRTEIVLLEIEDVDNEDFKGSPFFYSYCCDTFIAEFYNNYSCEKWNCAYDGWKIANKINNSFIVDL